MSVAAPDTRATISGAAVEAARAGGALALAAFRAAHGGMRAVEEKDGFADIVTATDRAVEAEIVRIIRARVPGSRILGEEGGWTGHGDTVWFIDPIDGTSNFASGLPFFCVSIAAWHQGRPVCGVIFDPVRDEMFLAEGGAAILNGNPLSAATAPATDRTVELLTNSPHEGARPDPVAITRFARMLGAFRAVRRLGSCALHLAYVAAGRAVVCEETRFHAWDVAAGLQLAAAAGCRIVARDGAGRPLGAGEGDLTRMASLVVAAPGFDYASSSLSNPVDDAAQEPPVSARCLSGPA